MAASKSSVPTSATKGDAARARAATEIDEISGEANVDKIREILFGGQMQDYERRFAELEARMKAAATEVREEARGRLDALESYVKKEMASIADRLSTERRERMDAIKDVTRDLREATKALERRLGDLDERTARDDSELRDRLLQQSKTLADDLRRTQVSLSDLIGTETRALRAEKTDRQVLAGLLADVAMRLSDQGETSAGETP